MTVTIEKSVAQGIINAPPSKSMAHRSLICGALSGKSEISNVAYSQDILATIDCLKALGATISENDGNITIGGADPFGAGNVTLDCRESGSTLRFMLPLCLLSNEEKTLVGSGRLMDRPMTVYENLFKEKGISFYKDGKCIKVKGKLKGGVYTVEGGVSSQFISGLLFALPLLEEDSIINIVGDLQSQSYLNLTLSSLKAFGINVDSSDIRNIKIKGNQRYKSQAIAVEGDYSNAAFFEALNFLGGNVTVKGLDKNSLQGDKVYLDLFPILEKGEGEISLADCPDLGPILFSLAAAKKGATFTDTARLRIKESDRVLCMEKELKKFGIKMDIEENKVKVYGGELKKPTENLYGHNDHRIVMSMAVLSTLTGGTIEDAGAVNKSLPDFFERIKRLGIKVNINET
jgi:3-phosphoshikimate 1-carboxyvinyltransferase